MRLRLLSAKKPTDRLSGDQKGNSAPSVPGRERAETESSLRSHNRDWPSTVATNTIFCPSAEMASDTGSVVGGVLISTRISGATCTERKATIIAATAIRLMTATTGIQPSRSLCDVFRTIWPTPVVSFLLQAPTQQTSDTFRGLSRQASPLRLGFEDPGQHLADCFTLKHCASAEHLVE